MFQWLRSKMQQRQERQEQERQRAEQKSQEGLKAMLEATPEQWAEVLKGVEDRQKKDGYRRYPGRSEP